MLYNQTLPYSALASRPPLQAMKDWHTPRSELFKKQPRYLTGCDTHHSFIELAGKRKKYKLFKKKCCINLRGTKSETKSKLGIIRIEGFWRNACTWFKILANSVPCSLDFGLFSGRYPAQRHGYDVRIWLLHARRSHSRVFV